MIDVWVIEEWETKGIRRGTRHRRHSFWRNLWWISFYAQQPAEYVDIRHFRRTRKPAVARVEILRIKRLHQISREVVKLQKLAKKIGAMDFSEPAQ